MGGRGVPEEKRGKKKEKERSKKGEEKGRGQGIHANEITCRVKTLGSVRVNVRIGMKKYNYGQ